MKRVSRQEQRAQTRAELLAAARRLFAEKGLFRTTVEAIAERAGRTTGALYANFTSKEDMLVTLIREQLDVDQEVFERAADGMDDEDDIGDRLRGLMRGILGSAMASTANELALLFETHAHVARNDELRATVGAIWGDRLRQLGAQIGPIPLRAGLTGVDVVVLGQALLDGLALRSAVNPDLVHERLYTEGLALLAGLLDDQA